MRTVYSILLLLFVAALVTFIVQNPHSVKIQFLNWSRDAPMAALSLGFYVLGMLSGWTVVAFLRRSIRSIRDSDLHQ